MKFFNNIKEIKNRLILILISLTSLLVVTFYYQKTLLYLSVKPSLFLFQEDSFYFIFTDLTEIFITYVNLNTFVSLNITGLLTLLHFFFFLTPIFYFLEYEIVKKKVILVITFWITSFLVSYYVIIPSSWEFFLNFQKTNTKKDATHFFEIFFEARISEYVDFFIDVQIMSAAIVFTVFGVFSFFIEKEKDAIAKIKVYRKHIFFVIFFLSAIISPPEISVQLTISGLICLLFEMILMKHLFYKYYFFDE